VCMCVCARARTHAFVRVCACDCIHKFRGIRINKNLQFEDEIRLFGLVPHAVKSNTVGVFATLCVCVCVRVCMCVCVCEGVCG